MWGGGKDRAAADFGLSGVQKITTTTHVAYICQQIFNVANNICDPPTYVIAESTHTIGNGSLTMETGLSIMKPNHWEFFLREVKAQMQQNPSG